MVPHPRGQTACGCQTNVLEYNNEYDNLRKVSGRTPGVGARTLRKILLALVRAVCALRKCARPGATAYSGRNKVRAARRISLRSALWPARPGSALRPRRIELRIGRYTSRLPPRARRLR